MGPAKAEPAPVLVIEDEPAIVELLRALMADLPAEVVPAASAAETRALLPPAGRRPALITLDLVLRDADGIQVLGELRRLRDLDDVPVVVISAQTDFASQRRAYAAGASDFVAKPFSVELLDAKLRAWLRLSRLCAAPQRVRDFAHEARNPLLAIGAAAQVLRRPDADGELRQRLCRAIEEEADRLGRLLQGLDGGAAAPGAAMAEPEQLLRAVVAFNVPDPGARARLHLAIDGPLPTLRIDPDRLRQMVLNLLDNALDATARGGEVFLEARAEGGGLTLRVRDTGPGIAPGDLARIFEDGFTTRGGAARGLGLGITRRLCQANGGRLTVESAPGAGATFTLWLPRQGVA